MAWQRHGPYSSCLFHCYSRAYWASPLPTDQFSLLTSTGLLKTSSGRMPCAFPSPSVIALKRNKGLGHGVVQGNP